METQSTRISRFVIDEIGKIAEEIGNPTDDTAMRHVIAEYKRLKLENVILKKKIEEYEFKADAEYARINECD